MSALIGDIKKIPQEKGPEVELAVFGDEYYARYENKGGYAAIYDEQMGLFTYAEVIDGKYISGRDPLMGLSFVIWKSQEFLQAPDMID